MTSTEYEALIIELLRDEKVTPATAAIAQLLYQPDTRLGPVLASVIDDYDNERTTDGAALERACALIFRGLRGISVFKSYRSAAGQFDLLVSGDDPSWLIFCSTLRVSRETRGILMECKARTREKVDTAEMTRLSYYVCTQFERTVGLGIFLSLAGFTGAPRAGKRSSTLAEARLVQALTYARTGKAIIVIERTELAELLQPGALVSLLRRKLEEIEALHGTPTTLPSDLADVDLPPHLADVFAGGAASVP